jgi:hypothetical protein
MDIPCLVKVLIGLLSGQSRVITMKRDEMGALIYHEMHQICGIINLGNISLRLWGIHPAAPECCGGGKASCHQRVLSMRQVLRLAPEFLFAAGL